MVTLEERLAYSEPTVPRVDRRLEGELARRDREREETIERLLAEFDAKPAESLEGLLREHVHVSADRIRHALPRLDKRRVEALLKRQLRLEHGVLVPVISGAGYGVGAGATFRNAPIGTRGKDWDVNPSLFYALTQRNEQLVQQPAKASGWDVASPLDFPLPKVGILHELCLIFTGTMTVTPGTGTFTQGWKWPFGNFGNISLLAGGENALQYGRGGDFRTRIERLYRNPPTGSLGGAGAGVSAGLVSSNAGTGIGILASGANTIKVILKIPVAHDLRTGMGAIYRQSDDLWLTLHVDPAVFAELITLTGNATAVWSATNVQCVETYMTPERDNHSVIVLPDVTHIFETSTSDVFFSNNGTLRHPIPRLAGRLLSISQTLDAGNAISVAPASLSQIRFKYGANKQPVTLVPDRALEINRRNYYGTLHGGNYYAIDGEVDNPARDIWIPTNFTEGAIEVDIPSSITPAANSRSHLFFENLVDAMVG